MEGKQKIALTFGLYQNEALVRRETVTQDIVKIGKDVKSHLRVEDELASRMHAVIEVGAGADDITLIDLGNEPGTLVNGARVNKCKVGVGDQIQIGGTKIVLEKAEAVAMASAASGVSQSQPPAPAAAAPFGGAAAANPFGAPAASPFGASADPFGATAGANPFAAGSAFNDPFGAATAFAPPPHDEVPHDAPEGSYTYAMIKGGPPIASDEVETSATSVEVMVLWDQSVLHVAHLTPPRSFYVGEEEGANVRCHYFVPAEKLGTTRAPIVLADSSRVSVVLLPRATGTIEINGQTMTLQDAIASGQTQPCQELSGAHQMALPVGGKAKIILDNGLTFQVSAVNAGRKVAGHLALAAAPIAFFGLSSAIHGGLLAAMFFFMPALSSTEDEGMSNDQKHMLAQMLKAAAEKEFEEKKPEEVTENVTEQKDGGTGTRAKGEEGSMGNPTTTATNKRYAVKGPSNNEDPHLARQAALRDAQEFGMIGLLNSGAGGDPDAPTAPWGRDESLGQDEKSARGNMWGDEIGDAYGAGGLGLSGIGEGGGGRGEGIGLGNIGTLGHGAGTGTGQGFGNGAGAGALRGGHTSKPPSVRMGATSVSGRLPPEVIQRIVRQNFGRFRLCYENGLRNNPNLRGRVSVSFVIGRDGSVGSVGGGGDLPDGGVVSCVTKAFYGLSFPQPEGGVVKVSYPIMFEPGG
ncbi:MAG: AgmX/PglI C-terminal domain-containing protein [Polyangiaceae bacterium]